jgi:hypothetical protein
MSAINNIRTLAGILTGGPASDDATAGNGQPQGDETEQLLNPVTSERRHWRDPLTGTQREIWRPGNLHT